MRGGGPSINECIFGIGTRLEAKKQPNKHVILEVLNYLLFYSSKVLCTYINFYLSQATMYFYLGDSQSPGGDE